MFRYMHTSRSEFPRVNLIVKVPAPAEKASEERHDLTPEEWFAGIESSNAKSARAAKLVRPEFGVEDLQEAA